MRSPKAQGCPLAGEGKEVLVLLSFPDFLGSMESCEDFWEWFEHLLVLLLLWGTAQLLWTLAGL